MEFRYGTTDEPPPPPLRYQEPPPAKNSYFTEQDIRAGYRRPGFGLADEYFSQGFGNANEYCGPGIGEANECFWNEIYIREAIQRKIEKEMIREEIIAAEITRRQVLEAEVRAEMSIERELALRARGGSAFDRFSFPVGAGMGLEPTVIPFPREVKGLSLEERIAMSAEERIGLRARLETQRFETVPFQRGSANPKIKDVVPSPTGVGNEKEKIVFLPNTHLAGAQRKAVSPAEESANELLSFRVANKKVKEEWNCAICQVRASSESGLYEHIQGKKHKSKEDAFMARMSGNNIGIGVSPKKTVKPILEVTRVLSSDKGLKLGGEVLHTNQSGQSSLHVVSTTECLEKKNVSMLQESEKIAKLKKKSLVWVKRVLNNRQKKMKEFTILGEMCQVGTYSANVMEEQMKGEKHSTQLQKAKENGQTIPALQIVGIQGANDADEVTKERENENFENVNGTVNEEDIENDDVTASEEEGAQLTNQSVQSSLHIVSATECLDKKNVSMLQESEKIGKLKKKNLVQVQKVPNNGQKKIEEFTFWCEMCQVGTYSANVMEGHMKGKKHSTRLQKAKENGQAIPTLHEVTRERVKENFENVGPANEEGIGNDDVIANKEEEDHEAAKGDVNELVTLMNIQSM